MSNSIDSLKKGVVLAELGGYGNGPYCAKHGAGAALVMMGSYIVDPGDTVPYHKDFVFKPDKSVYVPYLQEHVAAAHSGGLKVGVSVATVELSHTLDFLSAAEDAGADYISLCAHSTMDMFVREHLGEELSRSENIDLQKKWAQAILDNTTVPVIFKIGLTESDRTIGAVHRLAEIGIPIVHINIETCNPGCRGLDVLGELRGVCQCLIAGGGITDIEDARRVLDAGADAVAVGTAAMKDPLLCGSLQKMLRGDTSG